LRHSFASFLVNEGVSLYIVQALLGHANARTTQRYAHLAGDTLTDAAEIVDGIVAVRRQMGAAVGAVAASSSQPSTLI
jgi:site-specific recombinase XerC